MKPDRMAAWLSFGAPLLIVLAVVASQQRDGNDRVQVLPAVAVGSALTVSSVFGRRRSRVKLLQALRHQHQKY